MRVVRIFHAVLRILAFSLLLVAYPGAAIAACYNNVWSILTPYSPLAVTKKTPEETCAEAAYLEILWPVKTLDSMVPISYDASGNTLTPTSFTCNYTLSDPSDGTSTQKSWTTGLYYKGAWSTLPPNEGWGSGAGPKGDSCGCPSGMCCGTVGNAPGVPGSTGIGSV